VGEGAALAIVAERERGGPFKSLVDFCGRLTSQDVNKKVIESLVRSGAFDSVETNRARLFNGIDFAMARAAGAQRDRASGQGSLFDLLAPAERERRTDDLPVSEPWPESDLLKGEKELLGVYMSGHPLSRHSALLARYRLTTVEGLASLDDRTETRIGGIIVSVTKRVTKAKQELMAVVQLEDLDGSVEVVVFPEAYGKYGAQLEAEAAVLVCGEVSKKEDVPRIHASEIYPLADAPKFFATEVRVHVPAAHATDGVLDRIRETARLHPGTSRLIMCILFPSGEKVFIETGAGFKVCADEELVRDIEHALGEGSVYVAVNPNPCRNSKPARANYSRP
jgi:DNA polymerase III subunit alpha